MKLVLILPYFLINEIYQFYTIIRLVSGIDVATPITKTYFSNISSITCYQYQIYFLDRRIIGQS